MKIIVTFCVIILSIGLAQGSLDPLVKLPEDVEDRIVQGWPSSNGQFPHQVHLRLVTDQGTLNACGGSLIDPQWVLTAAHCLTNKTAVFIRLGDINVTTPYLILESTNFTIHPNYQPTLLHNDVGLINLGRMVQISDRISPIRIPRRDAINFAGKVAIASGWGRTSNNGPVSETMNYVNLAVIENSKCIEDYNSNIIINSTICAVGIESPAQSTCNGDSGGSLMLVENDGRPTLIGVVSFVSSRGCDSDTPSGYVRPQFFHDWITNVTGIIF